MPSVTDTKVSIEVWQGSVCQLPGKPSLLRMHIQLLEELALLLELPQLCHCRVVLRGLRAVNV